MIVLKRISWRVQPIDQIRKRKQRRRDMWERHEKFAEYVERVKKKRGLTMTNRQWLASMSDGQLAKFIRSLHFDTCEACTYKEGCPGFGVEEDFCLLGVEQWLKQEHEENSNEL